MISNTREIQALQQAFRNTMNSFAQPGLLGEVHPVRDEGEQAECPLPACFELVVRTLVDQAVTFAVSGARGADIEQWVALQTHSHPTDVEQADFILLPDVAHSFVCRDALLKAYKGSLITPEKGATILLLCGSLAGERIPGAEGQAVNPGDKTYRVKVSGPGIQGTHVFYVDRTDWIEARCERGDEYPCGIDLILIDKDGHVVAIPRTTKILSVEKEGAAWDM